MEAIIGCVGGSTLDGALESAWGRVSRALRLGALRL